MEVDEVKENSTVNGNGDAVQILGMKPHMGMMTLQMFCATNTK